VPAKSNASLSASGPVPLKGGAQPQASKALEDENIPEKKEETGPTEKVAKSDATGDNSQEGGHAKGTIKSKASSSAKKDEKASTQPIRVSESLVLEGEDAPIKPKVSASKSEGAVAKVTESKIPDSVLLSTPPEEGKSQDSVQSTGQDQSKTATGKQPQESDSSQQKPPAPKAVVTKSESKETVAVAPKGAVSKSDSKDVPAAPPKATATKSDSRDNAAAPSPVSQKVVVTKSDAQDSPAPTAKTAAVKSEPPASVPKPVVAKSDGQNGGALPQKAAVVKTETPVSAPHSDAQSTPVKAAAKPEPQNSIVASPVRETASKGSESQDAAKGPIAKSDSQDTSAKAPLKVGNKAAAPETAQVKTTAAAAPKPANTPASTTAHRSSTDVPPQPSNDTLVHEKAALEASFAKEIETLKVNHIKTVEALKASNQQEISNLKARHDQERAHYDKGITELKQKQAEVQESKSKLEAELLDLRNERERNAQALQSEKQKHAREMENLKERSESERRQVESDHAEEQKQNKVVNEMYRELEDKKRKLQLEHQEVDRVRATLAEDLKRLQADADRSQKLEMDGMIITFQQQKRELEERHRRELSRLQQDHDLEMNRKRGNRDIIVADTLEEVCSEMGIDTALINTVKEYNDAIVKHGNDPVFFKENDYLIPIRGQKYYCAKCRRHAYGVMGGLRINYRTEVQDLNGDSIPGLYAAGNDANAIYGDTYPFALAGNTSSFAINTGRIAGEQSSAYARRCFMNNE
jgi:hypothetical protein